VHNTLPAEVLLRIDELSKRDKALDEKFPGISDSRKKRLCMLMT